VTAAFRTGQFEQASAYSLGGARQQFTKKAKRNVEAEPDFFSEPPVAFGVPHKSLKAARGEACARILGERVEDVLVSPLQQDVGHRGADLRTRGNRKQVRLGFCAGDLDQVAVTQPRRGGQNRFGDHDVVVAGKPADHLDGSIVNRRKAAAQVPRAPSIRFS